MTNFEKYRNPILQINKRGIIIYCNLSALEKFEWTQLVNKSCLVLIEESLRNMHQEIFKNEKDNSYYNFNITVNVLSENFDTNKWNMNILPYEEGWICFFSPITELQKKVDMNIRLNNHINSFLEHELKQKFAGISLSIENILSINDGENIVIKRDELKELMFISNRGKELCFNSIIQRKIFDDTYEITKTYFPIKNLYSYIDVDTQVISNNPIIEENLEKISLKADWNLIHHIVDNTLVNSKIHGYDIKICWEINENGIIYQIKNKVLPIKTFEKSKISQAKMEEIRQHFKSKLLPLSADKEIDYRLHFRLWSDGNLSIPNALALPSGDIIVTDKFVELSKNQDEIDSVILHEMGHVVHRHTLKMVIESTFITVATMMIVGDSNGLADMGVGLGSLLVSSSYSRGHESEADRYAFEQMLTAKIDPMAFSDIMNRMMSHMEQSSKNDKNGKEPDEDVLDYLSSHPTTKERVEIAQQYSQCFKKGLTTCEIVLEPQ